MTLSDIIISITVWSKWVCISNFSSSKQAPEIPAFFSEGAALHFLVSKVLLSLTATPFSCSSFSSIRLPFIFFPSSARLCLSQQPLSLYLLFRLPPVFLPPSLFLMSLCHFPLAFSSFIFSACHLLVQFWSKKGARERFSDLVNCTSSFVFMPKQSLLQGCIGVVLIAVSLSSSIWVEGKGTGNGCIIVQSVPAANRLIWSQLSKKSVCCNKVQPDSLHTPARCSGPVFPAHGRKRRLLSFPGHPHWTRWGAGRGGGLGIIGEKRTRQKQGAALFSSPFYAGGEESWGLMTQSPACGAVQKLQRCLGYKGIFWLGRQRSEYSQKKRVGGSNNSITCKAELTPV